jgi:hypothetical protein
VNILQEWQRPEYWRVAMMRSDQKLAIKCAWLDLRACNLQLAKDYTPEAKELTEATRKTIEELETKFPLIFTP